MSYEKPNFNNESEKKIKSIEDIRKISKGLPKDPEELNTLTQEVSELIISGGIESESEDSLMELIGEIDMADSKDLSPEQKRFLEMIHDMFETHIDKKSL